MTGLERLRAYRKNPIFVTLALSLLANVWSFNKLADFMHSEAKEVMTLMAVLLGAALALWIGLFWISNTRFGLWLSEKGELEDINDTYNFSVVLFFVGALGCIASAYLKPEHIWVQNVVLWIVLLAFVEVWGLLRNTKNLLRLHTEFNRRSNKIQQIRSGDDARPS